MGYNPRKINRLTGARCPECKEYSRLEEMLVVTYREEWSRGAIAGYHAELGCDFCGNLWEVEKGELEEDD